MVEIEFDNNQVITMIQANVEDLFKDVINKYLGKALISPENVSFIANGSVINPNLTVEKQMNNLDKENKKMKVIVNVMKEDDDKAIIKSKEIICPKCHEPCRIKLENYKIKLYDCINGHVNENINLIDFNNTQKIDLSKIICHKCKEKNKGNSFENEFYICLNCNENLCPMCKYKHEKEDIKHNIIKYDQKFFLCQKHNDIFTEYCQDCKKNLCYSCADEHKGHKTVAFKSLIPNEDEIKEKLSEIKNNIESFNSKINIIIKQLTELMKAMEIYYDINIDILNNYSNQNRNYETLQNVNEINIDNPILELIKDINQNKNFSSKIFNIIDLNNRISLNEEELENLEYVNTNVKIPITIAQTEKILNQIKKCVCKINNGIGIFAKVVYKNNIHTLLITNENIIEQLEVNVEFYNNNNNKKSIIMNNKRNKYKYKNIQLVEIKADNDKINDFIEVDENILDNNNKKLYNNKNIYIIENNNNELSISYNVYNNKSEYNSIFSILLSINNNKLIGLNIDNENIFLMDIVTEYITNKIMQENAIKIKNINNINNNTNIKLNSMIIKYNIINSNNEIKLFGWSFVKNNKDKCYLLIDKQKYDLCHHFELNNEHKNNDKLLVELIETQPITDMSHMFHECSSLESLPDFCYWNTSYVTNLSYMFYGCGSINDLPDISNWNTSNVTNLTYIFYGCSSFNSLPDISKWDTSNVTDMSYIFSKCNSLTFLPNISKWDTSNVIDMSYMFSECSSLTSLPDISYWNTLYVTNMTYIFSKCSSLKSLPDISNWDTSKVTNMSHMFSECNSLNSLPDISKWDASNVTDANVSYMSYMFYECGSLNSFPNISQWNIKKVYNKENMFKGCNEKIIPKKFKENCLIF